MRYAFSCKSNVRTVVEIHILICERYGRYLPNTNVTYFPEITTPLGIPLLAFIPK